MVCTLRNSCQGDVIAHYPSLKATNPGSAINSVVSLEMEVTECDGGERTLLINTRPDLSLFFLFSEGNPVGPHVSGEGGGGNLVRWWLMAPVMRVWRGMYHSWKMSRGTPAGREGGHVGAGVKDGKDFFRGARKKGGEVSPLPPTYSLTRG